MSTSLDERAKRVRFAGGEQAKRNVQARLAEQKKRVAEKNAADKKRMKEVRDNGLAERQKAYEERQKKVKEIRAAEKETQDAAIDDEQEPREAGGGRKKFVGWILELIEEDRAPIQAALEMQIEAFAAVDDVDVLRSIHQDILDKTVILLPQTEPFKKGKRG